MKNNPGQDMEAEEQGDASTRAQVLASILEFGPATAGGLATRLQLTPAAIRRHLVVLIESGQLVASQERVYGHRGRGRPASVFSLTDEGRAQFYQAYDKLAINALAFLEKLGGEAAVTEFANQITEKVVVKYNEIRP
ncbi:MAG: ArsR family transcriptional regulator, partial [Propionibacteriaceae bacterium]|nr:ArsR family transcriptional regulator [Propionibacteriaceae bacterium]